MESLKIYRVEDNYVSFLHTHDSKVQFNKHKRRPYVGVVMLVGCYKYFVPMESPKPNHQNIKSGKHLMKLDNGNLGILGFNNMIPVPESALIEFDINKEPDTKYAELLKRQVSLCNKHKADILSHACSTYYEVVKKSNKFLRKICCDFKALEKACDKYNPNR